ncbi:MAG TPA: hypothetical protein VK783_16545 [Bacteroidia bacterium]|jgi:hypothetical protein|nr:hypothetical protein [Bacteroidia bacterium]
MSKKSLDRKAATLFVIANRTIGKTDQEIYTLLAEQYYDKKAIILLITSTVTPENKKKYKTYNVLLLGLIGITILFKILTILFLSITTTNALYLPFLIFLPILNIYFFYEINRYNGAMYRILGLLTIAGILQGFGFKREEGWVLTINLMLCIVVAGLAFYLDRNMVPDYRPNSLKKDVNGEYIIHPEP